MDLEELLSSGLLTEEKVLDAVPEWLLYTHYLNFEPELRRAVSSPFRPDERPSFSLFESTRGRVRASEYRWKDSALNISGDIFDLVKHLYQLRTRQEALRQIDQEFELGISSSSTTPKKSYVYQKPPRKNASQILVHSVPFTSEGQAYWQGYGVSEEILRRYAVTQITAFWTQPEQQTPYTPRGLAFAYQINGHYKIYQPFNPECKFLNNYPENYVEGFLQLPETGPLLVLTKSTKDVMVLHALGYAAVSPRSESTPFPGHLLVKLEQRFSRIVTLFDNDITKEQNWGKLAAAKYPYPAIFIPDELAQTGAKDISDHRKLHGEAATRELLSTLLSPFS